MNTTESVSTYIGFWVYGYKKDFPKGNSKNISTHLKDEGVVRIGYSRREDIFPFQHKGDILFTVGQKDYLGVPIQVEDYLNIEEFNKLTTKKFNTTGLLLCEYTSRRGLQNQLSETESTKQ